jgi:hypothetical protein
VAAARAGLLVPLQRIRVVLCGTTACACAARAGGVAGCAWRAGGARRPTRSPPAAPAAAGAGHHAALPCAHTPCSLSHATPAHLWPPGSRP